MLGGADNPNGELPSYITGADKSEKPPLLRYVPAGLMCRMSTLRDTVTSRA